MDKEKALNQINEIHNVIAASNSVLFSGKSLFYIGIMVLLIPLIEISTKYFTFGFDYGEHSTLIITFLHVGFYWGLSELIGRFTHEKESSTSPHPIANKAFRITRPIVFAIIGSVIAFVISGNGEFAFPVTFLLLGVLFNLYGRFSNQKVVNISWSYIFLGIIYIYLTKFEIPSIAWYFTTYLGASYILISKLISQKEAS